MELYKFIVHNKFSYAISIDVMNDDYELQSINECKRKNYLLEWKEVTKKIDFLFIKQILFGLIGKILEVVQPLDYE